MRAISGTRGSSGFGSHNREQMDKRTGEENNMTSVMWTVRAGSLIRSSPASETLRSVSPLEMVNAGDHCDRKISRQMLPLLLIFG